ncbi:MAG: L,D-transpeptidase family protein [Saprospiraceae bacterium]|nr:L,D-transpeptidase family protein [Saprospiraceae bacterium]
MINIDCVPKEREVIAQSEKEIILCRQFDRIGVDQNHFQLFIRVFKNERILELWLRGFMHHHFQKLGQYHICAISGILGPKRKEGDQQVPEGVYQIERFNPLSKYYLSLGLNYPNRSDLILGDPLLPGSDIFIHGGCQSLGCISVHDDTIKEIYTIARKAVRSGQSEIRVEIYPFDFTASNQNDLWEDRRLLKYHDFWLDLKNIYEHFRTYLVPAPFSIDEDGRYHLLSV